MRDTHAVGDQTVGIVLARLLELGYQVSLPFSGGCAYDLVIDEQGKLLRVQCKTAHLDNGVLIFNAYTVNSVTKKNVGYDSKADLFLIYAPATRKVYRLPVGGLKNQIYLRIDAPKNNQIGKVRWAKDYEF